MLGGGGAPGPVAGRRRQVGQAVGPQVRVSVAGRQTGVDVRGRHRRRRVVPLVVGVRHVARVVLTLPVGQTVSGSGGRATETAAGVRVRAIYNLHTQDAHHYIKQQGIAKRPFIFASYHVFDTTYITPNSTATCTFHPRTSASTPFYPQLYFTGYSVPRTPEPLLTISGSVHHRPAALNNSCGRWCS